MTFPLKSLLMFQLLGFYCKNSYVSWVLPLPLWSSLPKLFEIFHQIKLNYRLSFFKKIVFIFGCTGSSLLRELSLVVASRSYTLVAVHRLLEAVVAFVAERRL